MDTVVGMGLAGELADSGENEIVEHGGWGWRYKLEPDDYATINDFDCYGRVAFVEHRYGHQQERPDGFDGFARIVNGYRGDRFWWQPPADLIGDTDGLRRLAGLVTDILVYGFTMVRLERLRDDTDGYGKRIVDKYTIVGGVEPFQKKEDVADILSDLIHELSV
jgi:hypothetical protein